MSRKTTGRQHVRLIAGCAVALWGASAGAAERAAGTATKPDAPREALSHRVSKLVAAYEKPSRATVGVSAVDLRTGRGLLSVRAARPFTPASNQKLLTSAFILARYGGDYAFATHVYRRGDNVVVVGGYDPTLGDPVLAAEGERSIYAELDRWAAAAAGSFGERAVRDIELSSPAEKASPRHPDWPEDQYGRWYAAPAGALNFHNNCIDVFFEAGKTEAKPVLSPRSRYVAVVNKVKLGKRNLWSLRTADGGATVVLTGTVTGEKSWPLSVPVPQPAMLLGRVLADRLAAKGVRVAGSLRRVGPIPATADMTPLCTTSRPLAVVMARANKRSLNMAAECMLLCAGDGTWAGSAKLMAEGLVRAYAVRAGEIAPVDGSGLSCGNRVSPAAMTTVLAGVVARPDGAVLLRSLPVSGVDGTLARRLGGPGRRGRVAAKTGYIAGVSCLSGYVLDASGAPAVAFAVLVNDVPPGQAWQAKQLEDQVAAALVETVGR